MTALAWTLAAAAGAVALVEWWATWASRKEVRYVTKPLSLALLIGVAVTLEPFDDGVRAWMVAGLVLSLAGDVFLLGTGKKWFLGGLVSFLLGHVVYVVAMQSQFESAPLLLAGIAVVVACIATVGRTIVTKVRELGAEMVGPVAGYLVVISCMVVAAFGTGAPWAIVGAVLFYTSDATLAWNRFIAPRQILSLTVMVTYHLAQAGLVGWLVTG
jgi:uncharacterized membrane protein YhhN